MGRKQVAGLINRKGVWHIDKVIRGRRICESTGTSDIEEAERYLARRMEQIRQAEVYGVRPKRIFREAATSHLKEAPRPASNGCRPIKDTRSIHWPSALGGCSHGNTSILHRGPKESRLEETNDQLWAASCPTHPELGRGGVARRIRDDMACPRSQDQASSAKMTSREPYPLHGRSKSGSLTSCRLTWRRWHCSRSTPVAGIKRCAVSDGNGRLQIPELDTSVFIIPGQR